MVTDKNLLNSRMPSNQKEERVGQRDHETSRRINYSISNRIKVMVYLEEKEVKADQKVLKTK